MINGVEQKSEIQTIKPRTICLNLSDADCERISELCGEHNLTVPELLENFIGDLVGGTYTNGSDERMYANRWFERCWFGTFPEKTLLSWLLANGIDVREFLDLMDSIKVAYADLACYKTSSPINGEEIKFLKTVIKDCEREIADYKLQYMKEKPDANWETEVSAVKKWHLEKEQMIHGMK